MVKSFYEFAQTAANVTGATAAAIIPQLDPNMKAQWEKITNDFPRLFAFLTDLHKVSQGSWKVSPAQFTSMLNKHIVGAAGAKGIAQTAPIGSK